MRQNEASGESPRFYSVAATARMLGTSEMTLYRAIKDGEFPALKIRGRVVVPARALEVMSDTAVAESRAVDVAEWTTAESEVRHGHA
jgi:excisionase family DNA binding protein